MKTPLEFTPISSLKFATHLIPSYSRLPNCTPHSHPLLIYYSAFPSTTPPSDLEAHLPTNGLTPQWRYTMYSTTHYHSTTHEVLCVYSGRAKLLFGGEENPGKVEADVRAGDMIVVPAGVGHRLLEDVEGDFMMVGSYPKGCGWDMCYGKVAEEGKAKKVSGVKWLERDPLYGNDGPVVWGREERERRGGGKSEV